MGREGQRERLDAGVGLDRDWGVAEGGERDPAARPHELDAIGVARSAEAPYAGAAGAAGEGERRRHNVLGRVVPGLVGGAARHLDDRADEVVEQIELVRREVDEEPAAGDGRIDPPGQRARPRREGAIDADGRDADVADRAGVDQGFHSGEARHRPAVVGGEQRHARLPAGRDHRLALGVIEGHRLLDVDRLAGARGEDRVVLVRRGRRGDVDGVDLGITHQRLGVGVPARHAMAPRVVGGLGGVAAHHRDERGAIGLLEARTALDLRDVPAPDDAPANLVHRCIRLDRRGVYQAGIIPGWCGLVIRARRPAARRT